MLKDPSISEGSRPPSAEAISMAFLMEIRADMLRYAKHQLRHHDAAEDLVQDAIESALRHANEFAGRSTLKTWMFGILRHRIADHHRQGRRMVPWSNLIGDGEEWDEHVDALITANGLWQQGEAPPSWASPHESLQSSQFWRAVERCVAELPAAAGQAFLMKELMGLDCNEISEQLGITTGNCHVMLHRARVKLRESALQKWAPSLASA